MLCYLFNNIIITARADSPVQVRYKYTITRTTYSEKMLATISAEAKYDLKADDAARPGLLNMLDENRPIGDASVILRNLFPKFLKVTLDAHTKSFNTFHGFQLD